jgi:hypothetical protein
MHWDTRLAKHIIFKLLISWLYQSHKSFNEGISKWIAYSLPSNFYGFQHCCATHIAQYLPKPAKENELAFLALVISWSTWIRWACTSTTINVHGTQTIHMHVFDNAVSLSLGFSTNKLAEQGICGICHDLSWRLLLNDLWLVTQPWKSLRDRVPWLHGSLRYPTCKSPWGSCSHSPAPSLQVVASLPPPLVLVDNGGSCGASKMFCCPHTQ